MKHPDPERSIERLLKLAGERDMPSSESMERARLAAQESFRRMLEQRAPPAPKRSLFNAMLGFAVAAGLAAVAVFTWSNRPQPVPAELVARIDTLKGGATLLDPRGESPVRAARPIHAGDLLATSEGRVALTFGDSLSLRVSRRTRLRFDGREQVTLLEGSLYVDSGGVNAVPTLRIETPAGVVRHVGTQFQVSVDGDTTRVRVREGRVRLTRAAGAQSDISTGDELQVRGEELQWKRGLPTFGPDWEWSANVAPSLQIENRPLAEFLAWMIREHGWQLRYRDESLQQRTHEIRLHGSLDRLDTPAMLERVALVTGVPLSARDGVLWVGSAP